MSIYEGDQQTTQTGVINGVHAVMSNALVKSNAIANNATAYQFTASYTFHYPATTGTPVNYRKGVAYQLDAALKAALLAAGAPMVAL
jgi:hypothetical protein